jgi:hypothetical protein
MLFIKIVAVIADKTVWHACEGPAPCQYYQTGASAPA